jgi:hypothetical protein
MPFVPDLQALRRSRRAIRAAIEAAGRATAERGDDAQAANVVRAVNVGRPGSNAVSSRQTVIHRQGRTVERHETTESGPHGTTHHIGTSDGG